MKCKFRYIVVTVCISMTFVMFSQNEWTGYLPKLKPTSDFSVWTTYDFRFPTFTYEAGYEQIQPLSYQSNNRLAQTIGIDYMSYTLNYTFRLPFNTLSGDTPLSDYFSLSTGYAADNWEIDGYVGRTAGWYDVSDSVEDVVSETMMYRRDIVQVSAGLSGYYFLSPKYRYSHAMKSAYLQNTSGFSFYASFKQKYMTLGADSSLYSGIIEIPENPMAQLNRLFIYETSVTFGFTGLWTNGNWFLRGLAGFGPAIQIQNFNKEENTRTRVFIAPAMDFKVSFGYKTNGLYLSLNFPMELMFSYLPNETSMFFNNMNFGVTIGFQLHDLIKTANKRNLRDESEPF